MTRQPHHYRRGLAAAALLVLAAGVSACSSSAASQGPPPASTPHSSAHSPVSTPPSTPVSSAPDPSGDASTPTGKPVSAYWFSIGTAFPGATAWTLANVTKPTDPNGLGMDSEGSMFITGPHHAWMRFESPDTSASDSELRGALRETVRETRIKVTQGPSAITVDGHPALAVSGLNSQHDDTILVVIDRGPNRGFADAMLSCPTADFTSDQTSFQALLNSFHFEH